MKTYKSNINEIQLKRIKTEFPKAKISSSQDADEYARKFYHEDLTIYESMFLILLNRANNTIGYAKISQGGVSGTIVDTQIIAKYAIETLAKAVILVHNHPSGNLKPSESDKQITEKVKNTLNIFDCQVLDHLIITEDDFFSFGDNGII